jgi:hypothetical protein
MNPASLDTNAPPRLDLARTPTPLEFLPKISREMGVEIYIKRDDLTGMELSGNKIRKLEFIMADALKSGADTVVTCGGAQSNHARATAIAAAKLSLDCRLILRTADPSAPPAPTGNILLNCMAGAQIVWITPEEYRRRKNIFQREEKRLRQQGRTPYSIPEGASNALGAWGYIRAMAELARDISRLPEGLCAPHDDRGCHRFRGNHCRPDSGNPPPGFKRPHRRGKRLRRSRLFSGSDRHHLRDRHHDLRAGHSLLNESGISTLWTAMSGGGTPCHVRKRWP